MKTSLITAALLAGIAIPGLAFAQSAMPSAAPTTAAPATAATAAAKGVAVGAKVFGPQGEEVGTIETISGGNVVINTGTSRATLAETSFGTGAKGPIIGLTKAQLDAAVMQAKAQASSAMDAALVPGADVSSKDGIAVGKIESVEGDKVVVDRPRRGSGCAEPHPLHRRRPGTEAGDDRRRVRRRRECRGSDRNRAFRRGRSGRLTCLPAGGLASGRPHLPVWSRMVPTPLQVNLSAADEASRIGFPRGL